MDKYRVQVKGGTYDIEADNDADLEAAVAGLERGGQTEVPTEGEPVFVPPQSQQIPKPPSFMDELANPDPTKKYGTLMPLIQEPGGGNDWGHPAKWMSALYDIPGEIYDTIKRGGEAALSGDVEAMKRAAPEGASLAIGGPVVGRMARPALKGAEGVLERVRRAPEGIVDIPTPPRPVVQPAPTRAAVKEASQNAYKEAEAAGVVVRPEAFSSLVDDTAKAFDRAGGDETLHPNATAALKRLRADQKIGAPQTLEDLERLRRVANSAVKGATNDDQASKARIVLDGIDDFMDNLGWSHLVEGNPDKAIPALKRARELWRTNAKMADIEDIMSVTDRIDDPNYIKQQFRKIAKDTSKFKQYTKEEQKIIEQLARTGKLEAIGKLAPGLDGLAGLAKTTIYGTMGLANPLTAAIPFGALLAKRAGTKGRWANLADLQDMIARSSGIPGKP